ncbi:CRAL/TRIO domain-containing protein [Conidiobolus coronatus NRRL 28638]|uniref:CRAL/TRIO domain-containing protein n=1 Tax=Conidiobolus coronatus (strain ATCC 28846 / CBS 209.66 / NRRL 28638) TaxID=796925 RepID=A0A137P5Z3_CONC2|nr:CRAL/TRIO domain-containing protein [Conidiobolus coronatus NRRL 28638]|eukprot:KXN70416.1 CRAL/TRIO domain-containing protein [Conidiobolus coronatus NRRL 28638]
MSGGENSYLYLKSDQLITSRPTSADLTDVQLVLLNQFKANLPIIISPDKEEHDDEEFCDEACLLRYLRATRWKLDESVERLKSTLAWRRSYKPHKLRVDEFLEAGAKGQMYINGFDLDNRPIVHLVPANRTITDEDKKIQFLVFTLETAIKCLPPNVEKFAFIIDFRKHGSTASGSISLTGTRKTAQIFSAHYPERVGAVYFMESSWLLSGFFRFMSPLIDPVTRDKFNFVSLKQCLCSSSPLAKNIDYKYLYTEFGGVSKYKFKPETYYSEVKALYNNEDKN